MNSKEPETHPEIVTDKDWKARVKAEDAALDQSLRQESDAPAEEAKPDRPPAGGADASSPSDESDPGPEGTQAMPPADFMTLVSMFSTQAMVSLGVIPHPASNKAEPQLPLAKHFIDLLGVLEEKTRGNLELGEQSVLTQSLHQLRMAFVELSKSPR